MGEKKKTENNYAAMRTTGMTADCSWVDNLENVKLKIITLASIMFFRHSFNPLWRPTGIVVTVMARSLQEQKACIKPLTSRPAS